jgi:hypothetical protein
VGTIILFVSNYIGQVAKSFNQLADEAVLSTRCYSRSSLPGCKSMLFKFEKETLTKVWQIVFALVPIHVLNIFAAMLCSNHVDRFELPSSQLSAKLSTLFYRQFGNGLTPVGYRLT